MWTNAVFASVGEMFDNQAGGNSTFKIRAHGVLDEIVSKKFSYFIQIRFDFMMIDDDE